MRLGKLEVRKLQELKKWGERAPTAGQVWADLVRHGYVKVTDKVVTVHVMRLTPKGAKALEGRTS